MPEELKGDRSYHAALRRIGIKEPGEIRYGVPPQFTIPVDDLSHLTPPIEVGVEGCARTEPQQAARFSVPIELEVRGSPGLRGVWLLFAGSATQDIVLRISEATIITDDVAVLLPGFNVSPVVADSSLIWRKGTTTVTPVGANRGIILDPGQSWQIPIFVPPLAFIGLVGTGVNIAQTGSMVVQIVPGV